MARRRKPWPILLALVVAACVAAIVFSSITLRTDVADFLPEGRTPAARFMLGELRQGEATRLILIGIEGAPPQDLARISRDMRAALDKGGQFALVNNGQGLTDEAAEPPLFAERYLLSPAATEAAFEVPALRRDLGKLLEGLRSSASPLIARLGAADPIGAYLALARAWLSGSTVRTQEGVWFAADRDRALIAAETRVGGMDIAGQDRVAGAIAAAFAGARPGAARLLVAGPAVFARDAARAIRHDVDLISVLSVALVTALLLWRFRSPLVIAAIAIPVVLGVSAGALVVQAVFGFVHGIAFGFGMTMLGVTLDYPVLLMGHRKAGERAGGTIRRIGRTFALAVATATLGLTGIAFSGFPGLAQLGVFSLAGLLVAAAATRWLLPPLIVAADLAPVSAGDPARLLRIERLRAGRGWAILAVCGAGAFLAVVGGPRWEGDLAALSPVPARARALDAALRTELGVPDVGQVAVVRGASAQEVLRREEKLLPLFDRLQANRVIGDAELAARLLPSVATQEARRMALPAADVLTARLAEAERGLGFRPGAFAPFVAGVEATRSIRPVTPEAIGPVLAARLRPLLLRRGGAWLGLIAFRDVRDPAALATAFADGEAMYVDTRAEANAVVTGYTDRAWRWLAGGAGAAVAAMLLVLRDPWRVARVVGAVAAALLVAVALLTGAGARLSLIHVVALQFVAGIGLDYALFFARTQIDEEERARTLRTLVTCNAMTMLTFGLLASCQTPLLRDLGATVATGALAAMIFAFLFAGPMPRRSA